MAGAGSTSGAHLICPQRVKKSRLSSLFSREILNVFSLYEGKKYFFFEDIYTDWNDSELTATKFLPLTLSNGEIICFHPFYLYVGLDLHLTLFSGRGTFKYIVN